LPASEAAPTVAYPAGIGRRLGAMVYDVLLIIAIWMMTLFVWVLVNDGEAVRGVAVQLVLAAELVGFYLFFWSRQGQTLGMAAWRIKVVDLDGNPPAFKQLLIRIAAAPLSLLSCGIGYLWFYLGERRQTWHDRLSGTMVVHLPRGDGST
jgi:uncharacterized RDD family membrane protein YckC